MAAKQDPWAIIFAKRNSRALINSVLLLLGYIAWYLTRSLISSAHAYLIQVNLMTTNVYGDAQAISYGFQLISKLLSGAIVDYFNRPKAIFLTFGLISVIATIANSVWYTHAGFKVLYPVIKSCSSFARIAALKIISAWYPQTIFGTVASSIQMSSCIGEMITRVSVGGLSRKFSWPYVCYFCGGISGIFFIPILIFVRSRPPQKLSTTEAGATTQMPLTLADPPAYEDLKKQNNVTVISNVVANAEDADNDDIGKEEERRMTPHRFFHELLFPLLKVPKFHVIIMLSIISTVLRESIQSWVLQFLYIGLGIDGSDASQLSAIFGAFAFLSIFTGGYLHDKMPARRRCLIPVAFLGLTFIITVILCICTKYYLPDPKYLANNNPGIAWRIGIITLLTIMTFALTAPNSFFDGAYALDIAGRKAGALAAGIVSGSGYLGALFSNLVFKKYTADLAGWIDIWQIMVIIAGVTFLGGVLYSYLDYKDAVRKEATKGVDMQMKTVCETK